MAAITPAAMLRCFMECPTPDVVTRYHITMREGRKRSLGTIPKRIRHATLLMSEYHIPTYQYVPKCTRRCRQYPDRHGPGAVPPCPQKARIFETGAPPSLQRRLASPMHCGDLNSRRIEHWQSSASPAATGAEPREPLRHAPPSAARSRLLPAKMASARGRAADDRRRPIDSAGQSPITTSRRDRKTPARTEDSGAWLDPLRPSTALVVKI